MSFRSNIFGQKKEGGGLSPVPTNGLLAYWKFNEVSGTTLIDHSGNGYHGINSNADINQPAHIDTGYQFNGVDSSVDLQANIIGGLSQFTLGFWFKPPNANNNNIIYGQWDTPRIIVRTQSGGNLAMVVQTTNVQKAFLLQGFTNFNNFYFVLLEYNGATLTGWRDNVQGGVTLDVTGSITTSIQPERWGKERTNHGSHLIDEGFIYDRVLTQAEREIFWNDGNGITL